jgi:hypothetical protein
MLNTPSLTCQLLEQIPAMVQKENHWALVLQPCSTWTFETSLHQKFAVYEQVKNRKPSVKKDVISTSDKGC